MAAARAVAGATRLLVASLPAQPRAGMGGQLEFLHPTEPLHWREAEPPVVLAATDAEVTRPAPAIWPGSAPPARLRWRRVDFLYPDAAVLGLGDLRAAPALLAGAAEMLRRQRPVVVMDGRGAARLRDAARAMLPEGYGVSAVGDLLVAAPGRPRAVTPRPVTPRPVTMGWAFDAGLHAHGLHPPELGAPDGGRHTGAAAANFVRIGRPFGGAFGVRLHAADWGAGGPFDLDVDGARLAPVRTGGNWAEYGPVDLARVADPVLTVHLLAPPPVVDTVRWPRKIGPRLTRLELLPI